MEPNNRNTNPAPNEESRSQELNAKELIRKHIEDPNHEITDEDIRNVKIDFDDETSPLGAEMLSRIEEREEAGVDEDEHMTNEAVDEENVNDEDKPVTPWDVRE